ncbi:MAG: replicative DNA helicase [Verrucomicrobiales bacterium]
MATAAKKTSESTIPNPDVAALKLQALPAAMTGGSADARRPLPSSVDAEKGILACMLLDPMEAINVAMTKLRAESFHLPAHRLIFNLLVELRDGNKPIDPVSVQQVLVDRRRLDEVGGPSTVLELFSFVPTAAHIDFYVGIVQEKQVLRSVIDVCTKSIQRAYDEQEDVAALLDDAEREILAIRDAKEAGREMQSLREQVYEAFTQIERLIEDPDALNGLPSGFSDLDKMTKGLHGSEMVIIAARPSMGKTSLAMNIVEYLAIDLRKPCAVFSLEMSALQLIQRLICSRSRLNPFRIESGVLNTADFQRLTHVASELADAPIFIDDTPSLSIGEFKAKARRLHQRHKVELIAVDYLQLMRSTSRRAADNRQLEIAEISAGIKAVSKELDIPIVVLAQLNRSPEQREGGKPRLSDLRESGSIEQDADVVGLLVRPQYYADNEEEREAMQGEAELIIAKNRNGPTGPVGLTFLSEFMRFENRAHDAVTG